MPRPAACPRARHAHPFDARRRRAALAATLLGLASLAALSGCDDREPAAPAPGGGDGPVAAVAALFERYDVVALQEAHELREQGEFVQALVRHPDFAARVRTIVVEFGNQRFQDVADRFVAGGQVPDDTLRMIWRNNTTSPFQQWDAPMYEQFFRAVRAANADRPADRRVRVVLGDPLVVWERVRTRADVFPQLVARDTSYLGWIEREGYARGRKTLVIAGALHLLKRNGPPPAGMPEPGPTIVERLEARHPGTTYVVMPHVGFGPRSDSLEARLGDATRGALVPLDGHWLGGQDAGVVEVGAIVDASGRPQSVLAGRPLRHYADAYLLLGSRRTLTRSTWDPAVYRDSAYVAELDRRNRIRFGQPLDLAPLLAPRGPRYHADVP